MEIEEICNSNAFTNNRCMTFLNLTLKAGVTQILMF
jgi:hypothetical protein